jgi:hypothetical protein
MRMVQIDMKRERFTKGNIYSFITKKPRADIRDLGRTRRYSFINVVKGCDVHMFLFVSVLGKWKETFTSFQLDDYTITR